LKPSEIFTCIATSPDQFSIWFRQFVEKLRPAELRAWKELDDNQRYGASKVASDSLILIVAEKV
jgi:hypothetical protein